MKKPLVLKNITDKTFRCGPVEVPPGGLFEVGSPISAREWVSDGWAQVMSDRQLAEEQARSAAREVMNASAAAKAQPAAAKAAADKK